MKSIESTAVLTGSPRLIRLAGSAGERHLVCFPHAGGSPQAYRWCAAADHGGRTWAVSLPGRAGVSTADWLSLVARITDEMANLSGSVTLMGHSLGALVAYEVARRLEDRGADLRHLVVVSRGAPETGRVPRWPDDDDLLLEVVSEKYGGIPDELRAEPELLRAMAGPLRVDLELVRSYAWKVGRPLKCPITAVSGDRDATTSAAELAAWRHHTLGDFHAVTIPGGHFFAEQERTALLDIVRRRATT